MLKQFFFIGLGLLMLAGCNTKFDVNGEYHETAVVHFLLDQNEDYHFLKLNRTFLKEGNAYDFAKQAELSYFDNVVATVEEVKNGNVTRTWTLLDTVIDNKDDGAFYGPNQKLYYFKEDHTDDNARLDENALYKLKIDIDNGNHIVTGQTELVKGVNITKPGKSQTFNLADNNVEINGYKSTVIAFSKSPNGMIYKLALKTYYREFNSSGVDVKSVKLNLQELKASDITSNFPTILLKGERYYEFLGDRIKPDPDVYRRSLEAVEIIETVGADDLLTYMLVNEPSSSLSQNKPSYTNLDGGMGIFSARVTVKQYMPAYTTGPPISRCFNQNTMKELCGGQYTGSLLFCSDVPMDVNTNFYCP